MRTVEECYEYVLSRCDELAAQRRRKRKIALKAVTPVCGIVVIAGAVAVLPKGRINTSEYICSVNDPVLSSEIDESAVLSAEGSIENPVENPIESLPRYENELNIGEVEITGNVTYELYYIPLLYEMSRNEVLEHFGLSADLDLSGVVEGLCETAPKNSILNPDGKHGFCRTYIVDEEGNGAWEELHPHFDNEEFRFESADGTRFAEVFFSHEDKIDWLRNGILSPDENGGYSNRAFYALPMSTVTGVEMRIAKRSTGGYYAEFNTPTLCVGLSAKGLSENEIVSILEYLANYVGASDITDEKSMSVGEIADLHPDMDLN